MKIETKCWLALSALALPYLFWVANIYAENQAEMQAATERLEQTKKYIEWIRNAPDEEVWRVLQEKKKQRDTKQHNTVN